MNREQIDELMNAWLKQDEEELYQIMFQVIGIDPEKQKAASDSENDQYFYMLIKEIENSDEYKYFKSFVNIPEYAEFVVEIISACSEDKNNDKLNLIERREELGLKQYAIVNLIESINDDKFTKKCIEEREKLGLNSYNVSNLIKSINDEKFTKECVFKRRE